MMHLAPEILAIVRGCSAVELAALAALGMDVARMKPAACEWVPAPKRQAYTRREVKPPRKIADRPRIMRGRKGFRVLSDGGDKWESVALAAMALKIPESSLRRMIADERKIGGKVLRLERKAA